MGKQEESTHYEQLFYFCYGLIFGIIGAVVGGFFSTIAFEYLVKHDTTLEGAFRLWAIILAIVLVAMAVPMGYSLWKMHTGSRMNQSARTP